MARQTSSAPLSDFLLNQYEKPGGEKYGVEIKKVYFKKKVVGLSEKNPLETLLNKNFITEEEINASQHYVQDYTMANMPRHAKPNWGDTPKVANDKDDEIGDSWDKQCKAEESVNHVKFLLQSADTEYQLKPDAKGKRTHKAKKYIKILECVFENQKSIRYATSYLHMNDSYIEDRIKEMLKIMFNYYEL